MSGATSASRASLWHVLPDDPVGRAVVLPGSGYTVDHPLLWWTCQVLAESGWRVTTVRWEVDESARVDPASFVARAAEEALEAAGPADRTLVVGKSFGTWAIPWAIQHGYPGVWLTPVLSEPRLATALLDTGSVGLLVGGAADELWDGDVARRSGLDVLELDEADHILYTPGNWHQSFDALGRTLEAVQDFAARLT